MGYNLYITRKEDWSDEDSSLEISLTEWTSYCQQDDEMRMDNFAEARPSDGSYFKIEKEGIAVWKKYSLDGLNGNHAWFNHNFGNITVKNPDEEIIKKMISIAEQLAASVQGEEGEVYDESSFPLQ